MGKQLKDEQVYDCSEVLMINEFSLLDRCLFHKIYSAYVKYHYHSEIMSSCHRFMQKNFIDMNVNTI